MPSIDSISFNTSGLRLERDEPGRRVWSTPAGDGVGLNFFAKPPDLPPSLQSEEALVDAYRRLLKGSPAQLVSVGTSTIAGVRVIRLIIKAPKKPSGMTYIGSITFPFRDFSFVLKVQCVEQGATGTREAILFDQAFKKGEVRIEGGKMVGGFNAYDESYDSEFPKHPLSRLRGTLKAIEVSCIVDEATLASPPFPLP